MATSPTVQELLKRNNDIAATHKPQLLIPEMKPPNQLSPNMLIDCGCSYMKDPNVREALKERAPAEASKIDGMVFGAFDNLEQSVRDDLKIFKSSQFVREEMKKSVYGFVYDIQTGKLTGVA
ncbi:MAG: hypothetical protein Q9194_004422 [Teloschistes cf. exilis]